MDDDYWQARKMSEKLEISPVRGGQRSSTPSSYFTSSSAAASPFGTACGGGSPTKQGGGRGSPLKYSTSTDSDSAGNSLFSSSSSSSHSSPTKQHTSNALAPSFVTESSSYEGSSSRPSSLFLPASGPPKPLALRPLHSSSTANGRGIAEEGNGSEFSPPPMSWISKLDLDLDTYTDDGGESEQPYNEDERGTFSSFPSSKNNDIRNAKERSAIGEQEEMDTSRTFFEKNETRYLFVSGLPKGQEVDLTEVAEAFKVSFFCLLFLHSVHSSSLHSLLLASVLLLLLHFRSTLSLSLHPSFPPAHTSRFPQFVSLSLLPT